jgi:hypothetical protein
MLDRAGKRLGLTPARLAADTAYGKLDRLRLRGLDGARDEVLLAATAQNLRKLAKYADTASSRRDPLQFA